MVPTPPALPRLAAEPSSPSRSPPRGLAAGPAGRRRQSARQTAERVQAPRAGRNSAPDDLLRVRDCAGGHYGRKSETRYAIVWLGPKSVFQKERKTFVLL